MSSSDATTLSGSNKLATAPDTGNLRRAIPCLVLLATFGLILITRLQQPGDLYDADQPKTMAYTVDMILNHHWAMPMDNLRDPATKPPLYNWLSVPVLMAFQTWEPWAFKLVSVIAVAATCLLILAAARAFIEPQLIGVGAVAAAMLLASRPVIRLMYFSRPDMLLAAFMTGAWLFGTIALMRKDGKTRPWAALFWLCAGGATLTKGPPAVVPVIYVLLAAPLIAGDWRALRRMHWTFAIWFVLLPLLAWLGLGYHQGGRDFARVLWHEVHTRIVGGGPEGLERKPSWLMPVWFFSNFQPWSSLVVAVLIAIPFWRWAKHPLGPAILWMLIVLVLFCLPGSKRADYLLPMYPPASIVAAYLLLSVGGSVGMTALRASLVVLVYASLLAFYPERPGVSSSDEIENFAARIQPIIGRDRMVMIGVGGYQPLLSLLGRFDGTVPLSRSLRPGWQELLEKQINSADWVVMPLDEGFSATIECGETYVGQNARPLKLGLYRIGGEKHPSRQSLIARIPPVRTSTTEPLQAEEKNAPKGPAVNSD